MFIKYCGPAQDYTGYGEAVRHDLGALDAAGIKFNLECLRYTREITEYGDLGLLAQEATERQGDYKIKIVHATPNEFFSYKEADKYNIGRVFWETDKLPKDFADGCNEMDELWTGSEANKQAMIKGGVTKPIYIIPQAIDVTNTVHQSYTVGHGKDFKFYSIFEWTERKNPKALLEAFWREFQNEKDVSLSIKTYVDNFSMEKRKEILENIQALKDRIALPYYPPMYVFTGLLNRNQIYRFHQTFDCFVSAHRGEGWGIPQMEAMLLGKPVITTNYGGIHEYLTNGENAILLPYTFKQVLNSRSHQWYESDQQWADVDMQKLQEKMRFFYTYQKEAKLIGEKGKQFILTNFNFESVGEAMLERLNAI